jgi:hypothetical protein
LGKLGKVAPREIAVRFAFGAAISIGAGVVGQTVGARFGGMFLAFPAILPAGLTLIEKKEGTRRAGRNAIGAVLGGVALAVYAGVGEAAFGHLPGAVVLLLALGAWLAASAGLYALLAFFRPGDCDKSLD